MNLIPKICDSEAVGCDGPLPSLGRYSQSLFSNFLQSKLVIVVINIISYCITGNKCSASFVNTVPEESLRRVGLLTQPLCESRLEESFAMSQFSWHTSNKQKIWRWKGRRERGLLTNVFLAKLIKFFADFKKISAHFESPEFSFRHCVSVHTSSGQFYSRNCFKAYYK